MARTTKTAPKPATAAKPAAAPRARKPRAVPAPVPVAEIPAAPAVPVVASAAPPRNAPQPEGPQLKLKEFVERVLERSGAKRKDARPVIEATLAILGEALAKGESLILPPFGRARVNRQKDTTSGGTFTVKLKRGTGKPGSRKADKEALADDDE